MILLLYKRKQKLYFKLIQPDTAFSWISQFASHTTMTTTAANKGGRLATKEQSRINVTASDSDDFKKAFVVLSQLLTSCYGPRGSCKAIHNNSGGHVLVTSHGTRMLQCLHFSRPVLRLWASALQGHVSEFMDHSLFAGRLSLNLIQGAIELNCHRHPWEVVDLEETKKEMTRSSHCY